MSQFSTDFHHNIKKAIISLYDRDQRLKINGENFWIIEKDISERLKKVSNADLPNKVSHTILINMPHTIPFTIRAKIFSHLILQQK